MASMTLEDLASHLKKIDFCMLSTQAGSGRISSRPMSNNGDVEYDGDSWFFSYEETRKIAEIEGNKDVSLTFTAPPSLLGKPGIFIAIEGIASLVRDKAAFEEHWVADLERWFPEGIDTPGLVLIKVSASSIQYWDGEENGEVTLAASRSRP
ncbi:pyridoxamine 5'-phosphate oxidase [Rhizobium sp. J15]|uniref:pyridoxamine 5'-phosphate oxidase family protein n=1 Tax=Rhizobium sp. J15 TaxID=2035450 RepID=UPI000BE9154F|nr:pyridoxamine 5'-phosphate oxidase family protein [Rhizobium sp. J15]PDT16055.1 pyridoxamine 5'-phosphate oxidase [Rhizobium sp. J15]